jgi:hypothetical protein
MDFRNNHNKPSSFCIVIPGLESMPFLFSVPKNEKRKSKNLSDKDKASDQKRFDSTTNYFSLLSMEKKK